jgi:hypothetical protein
VQGVAAHAAQNFLPGKMVAVKVLWLIFYVLTATCHEKKFF